jgi:hypothetical protein
VSVTPNAPFQTLGVAKLDAPCEFTVTGRLTDKTELPGLHISITADCERPGKRQRLCNLETNISAPLGHLVVLGVTPTDASTSVFVVQVLRPDARK